MEWFNPFGGEGGGGGSSDAYTKAETNELLNQKVDKVSGKGLSTEDYTTEDKTKVDNLGTAAERDVPASGDAANDEAVLGNDSRLTDARPASDVSEWAKALTKPTYSYDEITGKPTINGITIEGNLTLEDLELYPMWVGTQAEYEVEKDTIDTDTVVIITDDQDVDNIPTQSSINLVYSGGVYAFVTQGLDNKVDKETGKGLSTEDYTTSEKTKLAELTNDYTDHTNKPSINGTTLSGNKTSADLGLVSAENDKGLSTNDYTNADKAAVETIDDKYPKVWDVELTQAQYDALPASKYVDGKNYYITDGNTDDPIIYGFHIDPDESDPSDAVTYLMDAVGMEPAKMGTTAFNYGSWKNAFFMPKPCMLKYDGTVDYYLDPNDFSKKVDGTASDISNYAYNGNAMMEFPKIWFKFVAGVAEGEGYFYVSNQQVDDTYHCWANYDSDGNQTDHFYMSIYNGVIYDGKMRSLSGKKLSPWSTTAYSSSATYAVDSVVNYDNKMWKCITAVETAEEFDSTKWEQFGFNGNTTGQQEIDAAVANDTTAKSEWYIDTWCDRVLITALLYLMGKSLDLQSTYGRGIDSGSQSAAENYTTGAANDKGLFYSVTANGNNVVKVFGIESFWACKWHRTAGCIGLNNGKVAYKMTSSTADGSTATAYNTTGGGYLVDNTVRPSSGYASKMGFGTWGLMPRSVTGGNSNVYYCDYFYTNNSTTTFALVGGHSASGLDCGFCVNLNVTFTNRSWIIAAALSCKPLA